jgi:RNA polymerase-interacting CarD/CdnL/TRCF family regulator
VTIIFTGQCNKIFQLFIKSQVTANSYKFTGKPLPIAKFQEELKDFLVLVPTDKILEITLDYVANDTEVKEFIAYIQSEEFPRIHTIVEHLKEYKEVSAFM